MAEEYCGGVNWWDTPSTTRNRSNHFDGGAVGGAASSTSTTTTAYGWLTDGSTTVDINAARSSLESVDASKMDGSSSLLVGLGLSSQPLDWNQQQQLLNVERRDNSFRSMLKEGVGLNTGPGPGPMFCAQQQLPWRDEKLLGGQPNDDSTSELKQLGQNQAQFSPSCSSMESTVTCQGHGFQLDNTSSSSSSAYSTNILQGYIATDQQQQQQQTQLNYQQQNYFGMSVNNNNHDQSWPTKVPQFLRATSPKQIQQQQQLHFSNNALYWNPSNNPVVNMNDVRPSFFSSLHNHLPMPTLEEKPKNMLEVRDSSSAVKKNAIENNKRGRNNEGGSSTLPPFKVRKEKVGDRITALQQLVSPFGKTDTASVLSEAIEYIKFLHEQVTVLSTPYLKSGASFQQQPSNDKTKMDEDGPKQDLRSRGLCLVPISSTFPMTHETTVDLWTPTFGGTFR